MNTETEVIEVPYDSLVPATLRAVVEEFITRAATDYGARECSLEQKIADVMRQLQSGDVKIVFDPPSGTANIVPAAALRR